MLKRDMASEPVVKGEAADLYDRMDDARLSTLLRLGNRSAFERIYDRYHKKLYYFALKYLRNTELTDDAVQDVFVKLWYKRGTLDPAKSLQSYLFTSLRNHVLNMIRNQKNKLLSAYELDEKDHPVPEQTHDDIAFKEFEHVIRSGLCELPEKRRMVFELKAMQGYSNSEVADKLMISVNTVKVHYYHSLKFIKQYIRQRSDMLE